MKTYETFDSYDGITAYADSFSEALGQVYNGQITELPANGQPGRAWEVEEGKAVEIDWSARHI